MGRPKGAKGKRTLAIEAFTAAVYGGSAAQQSAAGCMVTRAELVAAGGDMAKAQVEKARRLVVEVRAAQGLLDQALRAVVLEALEDLADRRGHADAAQLRALVTGFIGRVKAAGGDFTIGQALKLQGDERQALLPYTDRKQPIAVDLAGSGPAVVIMAQDGPAYAAAATDADFIEVFEGESELVSQVKSHDAPQTLALPGFEALPPAD